MFFCLWWSLSRCGGESLLVCWRWFVVVSSFFDWWWSWFCGCWGCVCVWRSRGDFWFDCWWDVLVWSCCCWWSERCWSWKSLFNLRFFGSVWCWGGSDVVNFDCWRWCGRRGCWVWLFGVCVLCWSGFCCWCCVLWLIWKGRFVIFCMFWGGWVGLCVFGRLLLFCLRGVVCVGGVRYYYCWF